MEQTHENKVQELHELLETVQQHQTYNQLEWYRPVPKQLEYHEAGQKYRQRMLMAGNQLGKTLSAGMEVAMHLTGRYPKWWPGKKFSRPVHIWVAGVTSESTRDNPQRILLGRGREWGSGTIPSDAYYAKPQLARGVPDSIDTVQVVHKTGGISTVKFKSYDQGREKWQGDTLDLIWCDEEPPAEIYDEALTRLNRRKGHMLVTFTPLMGMTDVVKRYFEPDYTNDPGAKDRKLVHMTLEDATFYSREDREYIKNQYSPAMQRARTQGLPLFGEGLIYPYGEEQLTVEPFTIPSYWRMICGLDHGTQHPTALAWVAYDPDQDVAYLCGEWKRSDTTIADRVAAWRQRGEWVPVAWPHDVGHRDGGVSGRSFADIYRSYGMRMVGHSARIKADTGGAQSREAVIAMVDARMRTGRFKVFRTCREWLSEQQRYHRKDGQVVDRDDDLISASHYAIMELRSARRAEQAEPPAKFAEGVDYDPLA